MGAFKDLTGQTFGCLKAIHQDQTARPVAWVCLCSCGNFAVVPSGHLVDGHTRSCGHLRVERGGRLGAGNRRYTAEQRLARRLVCRAVSAAKKARPCANALCLNYAIDPRGSVGLCGDCFVLSKQLQGYTIKGAKSEVPDLTMEEFDKWLTTRSRRKAQHSRRKSVNLALQIFRRNPEATASSPKAKR